MRPGDDLHVLGAFAAELHELPVAGAAHVLVSWALGTEGRRRHAGCALFDAGGARLGLAHATWIGIPRG